MRVGEWALAARAPLQEGCTHLGALLACGGRGRCVAICPSGSLKLLTNHIQIELHSCGSLDRSHIHLLVAWWSRELTPRHHAVST
jgi:ferredoxin